MSPHCRKADGSPKKIYSSRWDALIMIAASRRIGQIKPYPCATHGWHVGGILTRAQRRENASLGESERTRKEAELRVAWKRGRV